MEQTERAFLASRLVEGEQEEPSRVGGALGSKQDLNVSQPDYLVLFYFLEDFI